MATTRPRFSPANEHQLIGQQILNICAGKHHEAALLAQIDALATTIGAVQHLCGLSLAEAEEIAAEAGENILKHIRDNWDRIEVAQ